MRMDDRKLKILAAVVDEYIRTGEPVGSKALVELSGLSVSSATVRNDMAALESMGFLEQPHTSAGRVPTYKGYRFYIERLMKPEPLSAKERSVIDEMLGKSNAVTAESVIETATEALAQLTGCATFNTKNMPQISVITRVEVIPAGRRLYALLILTSSGAIKNRICRMEFDLTNEQLEFFDRFLNENLHGLKLDQLNPSLMQNLAAAMGSYMMTLTPLLYAVYELSNEFAASNVNLKGETRLLTNSEFDPGEVMRFLSHKNELAQLLSSVFDGIHVVFGQEENTLAITNSSMILSKYNLGNVNAGALGVIGPVRLDYAKMIPYIKYFSDSVTRMLSASDDFAEEGEQNEREEEKGSGSGS